MIGLDRGLNPPEPPTHLPCDACCEICDQGDLYAISDDYYVCQSCYKQWIEEIKIHPVELEPKPGHGRLV